MTKREFGADPELKRLYEIYLLIVLFSVFLSCMIPVVAFVMLAHAVDVGVILAI